jgi:hypothetical protein
MRWVGEVACMGERSCARRNLVGKAEEKGPLVKPILRLEDSMKSDLKEIR